MKGQQEKTVEEEDSQRDDYVKQKVEVEMVAMDTAYTVGEISCAARGRSTRGFSALNRGV